LLAGHILKIFFIAGCRFLTFELCFHILSFLMPFGLLFECNFKFFIMKKVGGPHVACGPHFGHACNISRVARLFFSFFSLSIT
jgi:hypothetical protein